jgi:hypothetical protein
MSWQIGFIQDGRRWLACDSEREKPAVRSTRRASRRNEHHGRLIMTRPAGTETARHTGKDMSHLWLMSVMASDTVAWQAVLINTYAKEANYRQLSYKSLHFNEATKLKFDITESIFQTSDVFQFFGVSGSIVLCNALIDCRDNSFKAINGVHVSSDLRLFFHGSSGAIFVLIRFQDPIQSYEMEP